MKKNLINYKHLYYFWVTSREGSLTKAAERLGLSVQTMSEQISQLEKDFGRMLLAPQGRRLVPTEAGRMAAGFADQIFLLGEQLREALADESLEGAVRLSVGVTDGLPKLLAYRFLEGVLASDPPPRLSAVEGHFEELLAELALHKIDMVLSDRPAPVSGSLRVFSHPLGTLPMGMFAVPKLLAKARKKFPQSLKEVPVLMPWRGNALRGQIDGWLEQEGVRPKVIAEFEDSALLKTVGSAGHGVFPAPLALKDDIARQYGAELVGEMPSVNEQVFLISNERKVRHPGVEAVLAQKLSLSPSL